MGGGQPQDFRTADRAQPACASCPVRVPASTAEPQDPAPRWVPTAGHGRLTPSLLYKQSKTPTEHQNPRADAHDATWECPRTGRALARACWRQLCPCSAVGNSQAGTWTQAKALWRRCPTLCRGRGFSAGVARTQPPVSPAALGTSSPGNWVCTTHPPRGLKPSSLLVHGDRSNSHRLSKRPRNQGLSCRPLPAPCSHGTEQAKTPSATKRTKTPAGTPTPLSAFRIQTGAPTVTALRGVLEAHQPRRADGSHWGAGPAHVTGCLAICKRMTHIRTPANSGTPTSERPHSQSAPGDACAASRAPVGGLAETQPPWTHSSTEGHTRARPAVPPGVPAAPALPSSRLTA